MRVRSKTKAVSLEAKTTPSEQRAVALRWTKELSKSWTPVSDVFLEKYHELGITTPQAMFVIQLIHYKWDEKAPYPSFKSLAKKMGVSITTARGYARELEHRKYLHREIRVDDTNIFHLQPLFRALEPFAKKETNID